LNCDLVTNAYGRSLDPHIHLSGFTFNVDTNMCYTIIGQDPNPYYDYDLDISTSVTDCTDVLCGIGTPTPTPTPTATSTPTPTPTVTSTPTPTPTVTSTPTPTIDLSGVTTYTISGCSSSNVIVADLGPGNFFPGDTFFLDFTGSTASECYTIINKIDTVPDDGGNPISSYSNCADCIDGTTTTYTISGCTNLNVLVADLGPGAFFAGDVFNITFTGATPSGCYKIINKIVDTPTDTGSPLTFYTTCQLCEAALPTATPTPTPTATPVLPTPTPTSTSTPTPTATSTSTPTPTATTASAPMTITITEVGSNVVMSASGTINLSGLTLVDPSAGPFGGGGLGVSTATFLMGTFPVNAAQYSGFTTTPSNYGTGGGGGGATSGSGDIFGIVYQGTPPYSLLVPTGYTSGTNITSTQTFTGTTLSTLGLTNGTYTYTWSGGSIDIVVGTGLGGPTPTPTPTATSSGGGMGSWYFYYTEGPLTVGAPTGNGNAIFRNLTDATQVFEPNFSNGTGELYFCTKDSSGTSFNTQFSNLQTNGGTLTITQGSNSAIFTSPTGNNFVYNPGGGGANGFLMIRSSQNITQTQTCSKFNGIDPISLSFS